MNNSHLPLQDGHTYVDAVGRSYRIGGTCRDYSEWVWSLNGWWFVRATGQHIHGYECRQTGKWVHRIGSLRDIVGESKRKRPESKRKRPESERKRPESERKRPESKRKRPENKENL